MILKHTHTILKGDSLPEVDRKWGIWDVIIMYPTPYSIYSRETIGHVQDEVALGEAAQGIRIRVLGGTVRVPTIQVLQSLAFRDLS